MKEFVPETAETLLARFASERDEGAFQSLVHRHLPFVYHAALRQLNGDHAAAEDVSIGVFADLATKATSVVSHPSLAGWLFTAIRQRTSNVRRDNARRRLRETLAAELMHPTATSEPHWNELRPLIDDALEELSEADRAAVLGRYFEDQPHTQLGERWGVSESAARMRVERATDRLRIVLGRRGVTSTTAAVGAALAGHAYCADLPSGIADRVVDRALAGLAPSASLVVAVTTGSRATIWQGLATAAFVAILVAVTVYRNSAARAELNAAADNLPRSTPVGSGPEISARPNVSGTVDISNQDQSMISGGLTLNVLNLDFRTAEGQPVGDVRMDVHYYSPDGTGGRVLTNNLHGMTLVEYPTNTTRLEIFTARDGWGDMTLRWDIARQELIPERQTVIVEPGVFLGGVVTDFNGKGMPGIIVTFYNGQNGEAEEKNLRSTLKVLETTTDSAGRWETRRVPKSLRERAILSFAGPELTQDQKYRSEKYGADRKVELAAAMANQHQARMQSTDTLVGRVLDDLGRPVAGALAAWGDPGIIQDCETCLRARSEIDGNFSLAGRFSDSAPIFIHAPEWALSINVVTNSGPTTIKLNRGRPLSLRFTELDGKLISNAIVDRIYVDLDQNNTVFLQRWFHPDSNGQLCWTNAPNYPLTLEVSSPGHQRRTVTVSANWAGEQAITLSPEAALQGVVVDDQTDEPIPRFLIKIGVLREMPGSSNIFWPQFVYEMPVFNNGLYRASANDSFNATQGGVGISGVFFRFESEGYEPLISKLIRLDAGTVTMNQRLHRATTADIWIMDAESHPVPSARIGLARNRTALTLASGRLSSGRGADQETMIDADPRGVFRASSDSYITRYLVTAPAGFASVDAEMARKSRRIDLQPWGKVRGTVLWSGVAASGEVIVRDGATFELGGSSLSESVTRAALSVDGSFLVPQVAPGTHVIQLRMGDQTQYLGEVVVRPGETATFDFRPAFRPVAVRVSWPAALVASASIRRYVVLETQNMLPPDSPNMDAATQEWVARPEVHAARLRQRRFVADEASPGQYIFPHVPPDRYELVVLITTGESPNYHFQTPVRRVLDLESAPHGELLDAGVLEFQGN